MKKLSTSAQRPVPERPRPLVLYVEDNDDNWNVAEMRLEKIYRLVRAKNDREACELLKRHAHELYVILMDIELQGSKLDGVALTRLVRGHLPEARKPDYASDVPTLDIPIIFTTAYHTTLTDDLRSAGGTFVVPKPVEFMRLVRELTSLHLSGVGAGRVQR